MKFTQTLNILIFAYDLLNSILSILNILAKKGIRIILIRLEVEMIDLSKIKKQKSRVKSLLSCKNIPSLLTILRGYLFIFDFNYNVCLFDHFGKSKIFFSQFYPSYLFLIQIILFLLLLSLLDHSSYNHLYSHRGYAYICSSRSELD